MRKRRLSRGGESLMPAVFHWSLIRWLYDVHLRIRRRDAPGEPFRLSDQLTTRDNPAIAIDFASFLFAMCLITRGSLTDLEPGIDSARYFGAFFVYQAIGCLVILVSRVLNDKLMLRKTDNVKAMVEERSVAVACVQAGTTIATALIFAASAAGGEASFGEGILLTLVYWVIGQVRTAPSLLASLEGMPPRTQYLDSATAPRLPCAGAARELRQHHRFPHLALEREPLRHGAPLLNVIPRPLHCLRLLL